MRSLSPYPRCLPRSRAVAAGLGPLALAVGLGTSGCGTEPEPIVPPPVAGLQHAEAAAVDSAVRFSAANTAVAAAGDATLAGTRIVRFDFTFADGSGVQSTAAPSLDHAFAAPGTYAVQLRVIDDLGRSSVVHSSISVASALGVACGDGDLALCDSGRCVAGACVTLACAGPEACPADLVCSGERCVLPERAGEDGTRRYGADGGRASLDAAP
ncbi:MAG: hypothetical protein RIT45_2682 [Pseudomonadota bacterium]